MSKPDIASSESGEEVGVQATLPVQAAIAPAVTQADELVAAIREVLWRDSETGKISNSYYPSVDLGERAPVLRRVFDGSLTAPTHPPAVGQLEAQVQILRNALSGLVSIIDNDNPWDAGNVAAFNAAVAEAREALSRTSLTSQGESDGN